MMRRPWNGFVKLKREKISFRRALPVFILFLSLLFNMQPFAMERNQEMSVVLVAVGEIDRNVMDWLKNDLAGSFNTQVFVGKGMPEPDYAFDQRRKQYSSTAILNAIVKQREYLPYEKVLGIVDHDLFVPELNFVFGEAGPKAAVISITRLRQMFYHLPEDQNLFHRRVLIEAVHELGHTYGLGHCGNPRCVMFFSNSLSDTDRKGPEFCPKCRKNLQSSVSQSKVEPMPK